MTKQFFGHAAAYWLDVVVVLNLVRHAIFFFEMFIDACTL